MKSKKILALALASVMCLSAACSSAAGSSGADGNASDETRAASSGDRYEIVFDNSKDQHFRLMITRDDMSTLETEGYNATITYWLEYTKDSELGLDSYDISRSESRYDADGNNVGELYALKDDIDGGFSEEEFRTILDNVLTITEDWKVFGDNGDMTEEPASTPVMSVDRIDFDDYKNDIEQVHVCYEYDDTELFNYLESIPMPDPEER